jgi:hypothetical protein
MTPTSSRRATTSQPRERISTVFWNLARGSGAETQSREPEDVVRHLLASLGALDGTRSSSRARAELSRDAMTFLLQLEHDPYYASPEQTRGGDKDSQSLVYSIGVLLFERLTGHHPFVESLSPMRCALARDRSSRVGKNNLCSLPTELRRILSKAMSPFPEDRWQGEGAMRDALESYLGRADTVVAWPMQPGDVPVAPVIMAEGSRPAHKPRRVARGTAPPPCPGSPARTIFESRREEALVPRMESAFPGLPEVLAPRESILGRLPWRAALSWRVGLAIAAIAAAAVVIGVVERGRSGEATASPAAPVVIAPTARAAAAPIEIPSAVVVVPVPATVEFDAEQGGARVAAAAPACFTDARLRGGKEVGVSLRFSAADGLSNRVYFGSGLTSGERACLEEALAGVAAGGPPERTVIVGYSLWLTPTSARHRVHTIE